MDKEIKHYEEILETVKLMRKNGTLLKCFENIPQLSSEEIYQLNQPMIDDEDDYKHLNDFCAITAMEYANSATQDMKKAKFYANYVENLYQNYKSREKDIKHPDILKFIKDYEADNKKESK